VHPRQTHVPWAKKQVVTNQLRPSPPTGRWPGNHLVSEGKPWSKKRSKDHVGQWTLPKVRSRVGSRGGAPTPHGRHKDTPTNPRGASSCELPSADARGWFPPIGETAQGNRIRRPTNRRTDATQQVDEQTDLVALFVSMLGTKRFLMEQCNSGWKRPRRMPASPVAVRRGPAQGTEPRDLGCIAPRICVINGAGLQGAHDRRSVPRPCGPPTRISTAARPTSTPARYTMPARPAQTGRARCTSDTRRTLRRSSRPRHAPAPATRARPQQPPPYTGPARPAQTGRIRCTIDAR
jgi:hypothetical protein